MKNVFQKKARLKNGCNGPALAKATARFAGASARRGQAMLLAVMALGGTMLGVTTIAGLLMLYQIRQATAFRDSAAAVFAADAGVEWALYNNIQLSGQPQISQLPFSYAQTPSVVCTDSSTAQVSCTATTSVQAISKGAAGPGGATKRAFLVYFSGVTSTVP